MENINFTREGAISKRKKEKKKGHIHMRVRGVDGGKSPPNSFMQPAGEVPKGDKEKEGYEKNKGIPHERRGTSGLRAFSTDEWLSRTHKGREEKTMAQPAMPLWLSSFEEDIDTYIFISSRDNKLYLGILRTYDQHGNIFLTHCVEKIIVPNKNYFSDVYVGNLIIRGDNIAYFGSVDEEKYTKMFDYSQNISSENEMNEVPDELSTRKKENETGEHIVLRYKPISHILKFMEESTVDSSIFEN
ncbi:U6 snRNA-associated Sm-like protein LSm1, putative (LSM1) [Plasmodium ovale curtisi]|nr:U6 snRNA-associated Sm-like protein LSm1, putative (LSM1) [Plasmodium ovale curtisi]